jgi:hypothetical protein
MKTLLASHVPVETILRDHDGYPRSICAHSLGDLRLTDTVGAVVMTPAESKMDVLIGHPCENRFRCYGINEVR